MLPVCPMCRLPAPGDDSPGAEDAAPPSEAAASSGGGEPAPSPMDDDEADEEGDPMEWDAPPPPLGPA
eukprot:10077896-Alexandrium_andersonii.AAC.1